MLFILSLWLLLLFSPTVLLASDDVLESQGFEYRNLPY